MKRLYLLGFLLVFLGCEKAKEKIGENLVMQALTDGQWVITKYEKNGYEMVGEFADYRWQFRTNHSVEAIKSGTVERTGTWQENVDAMTMTTNFPGSTHPVSLMNGIWEITDHGWTYVDAKQTVNGELVLLHLEKQ
ncbi:MAG TPA: hypothetical protein VFZ78_06750 [Flavisolibacter sp.]